MNHFILKKLQIKNILLIVFLFNILTTFSQNNNKAYFQYSNDSQIKINAVSNNSYKSLNVKVYNSSDETVTVYFPEGGFFRNSVSTEQDLLVLFNKELNVRAGENKEIVIPTACADPNKTAPANGRTSWTYDYDKKIGDLISFYHQNRIMVELLTGAEHHSTFEKRHNFLQMCVWVYYDASKSQILSFSTKYIFDGDSNASKEFVDAFYPLASSFIVMYKNM